MQYYFRARFGIQIFLVTKYPDEPLYYIYGKLKRAEFQFQSVRTPGIISRVVDPVGADTDPVPTLETKI